MQRGKVKWYDDKKGFGFIINSEGKEVFVHHVVIEGTGFKELKEGDEVEFDQKQFSKGLTAIKVRRVK